MIHRKLWWLTIGLVAMLIMGCGGGETFAPPWTLSDSCADSYRDSGSISREHTATVDPGAGTGYLHMRMDTHTTDISTRRGNAEGMFMLGGTYTPPVSGVYEFVFVYDYSGEGKVEWRGSGYRFAAAAGVTAMVGDVQSVTVPLYVRATSGDELDTVINALEGCAGIVAGAISGDWKKILEGIASVLKGYRSKSEKETLSGTEEIVILATLQAGQEYRFGVLTCAAVRVRASRYGNKAEANIKLEGGLREVRVRPQY